MARHELAAGARACPWTNPFGSPILALDGLRVSVLLPRSPSAYHSPPASGYLPKKKRIMMVRCVVESDDDFVAVEDVVSGWIQKRFFWKGKNLLVRTHSTSLGTASSPPSQTI